MVSSYETAWAQSKPTALATSNHLLTSTLSARLLSELRNSCFSPLSVQCALTLLLTGARHLTWADIAGALGIGAISPGELETNYKEFNDTLQDRPLWIPAGETAVFSIANSIWLSKRVAIQKVFSLQADEIFDAQVRDVDFRSRWALADINKWVTQKTNGKITSIAESVPQETLMVLANAVYFLCNWQQPFHKYATAEREFFPATGARRLVSTMHTKRECLYFENEELQAVAIPYKDQRFNMFILLPKPNCPMGRVADFLAKPQWWLNFKTTEVDLSLPRFTFSTAQELTTAIKEIGMPGIFTEQADFSGIVQPPHKIQVDAILHKTHICVNETGTEAAAVTAMEAQASFIMVDNSIKMNVNRPFAFALMNMPTQSALFAGTVSDPVEA
jgi:serine protease inhibitor